MKVSPRCEACGYDLAKADSGDGPAVFVILIGGFVVAFGALFTEFTLHPPIWVTMIVWLPMTLVISLALLRPFIQATPPKAITVAAIEPTSGHGLGLTRW